MLEMFWMTTFLWCELTFGSGMLKNVCERCHSERNEESRSGNPDLIGARFLVSLGMTGQTGFHHSARGRCE